MSDGPVSALGEAPGWYGKLGALGDFAQRRLREASVRRIDDWLSRAMSGSREHLGAQWLDSYLSAPVLRFAWAPGVLDERWWFGVLMPSCDNVGRYFPLLITQTRTRAPLDVIALDHLEAWFDHLARAAAHTLVEGASLDGFEHALHDAPPWPTPGTAIAIERHAIDHGEQHRFDARATLAHWLRGIAVGEIQARVHGCSIWWRNAPGDPEAQATLTQGLPDGARFAALLTGAAPPHWR